MGAFLRRFLIALVAALLLLVVGAAIYIPGAARASFPQIEGELDLAGLDGPVDVYRDSAGIPHIFASTEHDLYFAQGFVHAQDRFWQMDFQRHAGAGRLSEMLGGNTLDTDIFLRTMGWERVARQEYEGLGPRARSALHAYADGVNAYIEGKEGTELGLEYLFLKLLNSSYEVQPWHPINTLTWAKAMAWDLRDNMNTEIQRALLLGDFSAEQVAELYPPYPSDKPVIVEGFDPAAGEAAAQPAAEIAALQDLSAPLETAAQRFAALDELLGGAPGEGLGSNSWVVSGERTASGSPLLANDPHLSAQMPSIWYQNSLHCMPLSSACEIEVSGVSFVGAPGVIIGHNQRVAWGFTNLGADVMDLYILKLNPENPNQYELNGEWVDMELVEEDIVVAGGENHALTARLTRFGPIISDSYGPLAEFAQNAGVEVPEPYAIALRWTALEPNYILSAVLNFNYAQDWEEFRLAARDFAVPAQNLIYADVDGNIGYQMPGLIPIRAAGDGRYPVPGWTDEYDWLGYVPFEELPFVLNPESGYIVTANNAVVTDEYPYPIADGWDYGYRAQSVLDMLSEIGSGFDVETFAAMQAESRNLGALELLRVLREPPLGEGDLSAPLGLLAGWDGSQPLGSHEAAYFNAFWRHLLAATFHDDLPQGDWPGGNSRWFAVVGNLLQQPDSFWWDDKTTPDQVEDRDQILERAFVAAFEELDGDIDSRTWGDVHTVTFEHAVMSSFPLIDRIFNRGPYALPGGSAIVNANNWNAASGGYAVGGLPSKRSVMDLADWGNSLQIHTTGQSGHPYHPHYDDMIPIWAAVESLPMHWELSAIQEHAEGHLQLLPE